MEVSLVDEFSSMNAVYASSMVFFSDAGFFHTIEVSIMKTISNEDVLIEFSGTKLLWKDFYTKVNSYGVETLLNWM